MIDDVATETAVQAAEATAEATTEQVVNTEHAQMWQDAVNAAGGPTGVEQAVEEAATSTVGDDTTLSPEEIGTLASHLNVDQAQLDAVLVNQPADADGNYTIETVTNSIFSATNPELAANQTPMGMEGGSDAMLPGGSDAITSLDQAISQADTGSSTVGGSDAGLGINDGHINTASQAESSAYVGNLGALADNPNALEGHAEAAQENLTTMGEKLGLTKEEGETWSDFAGRIQAEPEFMNMMAEMDPDGSGRIGFDDARETGGAVGLSLVGPDADTFDRWDAYRELNGVENTADNFAAWWADDESFNPAIDPELAMDSWRNVYTEVGSQGLAADEDFSNHAEELMGSAAATEEDPVVDPDLLVDEAPAVDPELAEESEVDAEIVEEPAVDEEIEAEVDELMSQMS